MGNSRHISLASIPVLYKILTQLLLPQMNAYVLHAISFAKSIKNIRKFPDTVVQPLTLRLERPRQAYLSKIDASLVYIVKG